MRSWTRETGSNVPQRMARSRHASPRCFVLRELLDQVVRELIVKSADLHAVDSDSALGSIRMQRAPLLTACNAGASRRCTGPQLGDDWTC